MTSKPMLPTIVSNTGGLRCDWRHPVLFPKLVDWHKEGLSGSQIAMAVADEFVIPAGVAMTRNAVMGACHRAGLTGNRPKNKTSQHKYPVHRGRPRKALGQGPGSLATQAMQSRIGNIKQQRKQQGKSEASEIEQAMFGATESWEKLRIPFDINLRPHKEKEPIGLQQLTGRTCRWPLECDDGEATLFCGVDTGDATEQLPYCAAHSHLALGVPRAPLAPDDKRLRKRPSYR